MPPACTPTDADASELGAPFLSVAGAVVEGLASVDLSLAAGSFDFLQAALSERPSTKTHTPRGTLFMVPPYEAPMLTSGDWHGNSWTRKSRARANPTPATPYKIAPIPRPQ